MLLARVLSKIYKEDGIILQDEKNVKYGITLEEYISWQAVKTSLFLSSQCVFNIKLFHIYSMV